jgi:hypothetical protein
MSMSSDDAVVRTQGVSSQVFDEDGEVVGHALLLDLDGCDELTARRTLDQLDGVRALLVSSPGSYHLWSLGVEEQLREQVLRALAIWSADDAHAGASLRRGYSVLRLGRKRTSGGATYKNAPELRDVRIGASERPQSRGHYELLRSISSEPTTDADPLPPRHETPLAWTGDAQQLRVDHYETLTDAGKEAMRP